MFSEARALIDVPCHQNVNKFIAKRKNKLAVYLQCSAAPVTGRKSILIHSRGLLTHYRQILIKSKRTRSLTIGISGGENKKMPLLLLRAPSAVFRYDWLISHLFVLHSISDRTAWLCSPIIQIQKLNSLWHIEWQLWTRINLVLMPCAKICFIALHYRQNHSTKTFHAHLLNYFL